jgi:hypothetical protein
VITRLKAHGYRCFLSLFVDLDSYHVLAGATGAGKMLRYQRIVGARHHEARVVNADFGELAAVTSVKQCQDPAFNILRDHLRTWFPEQS